ncbi:MAG: sigma-54 factor interaction domain-containing protein [Desulfobacterales bacterium]|nr:sigma-54 factor interaction domain-containing protein [Desulfobacterales bacterium]
MCRPFGKPARIGTLRVRKGRLYRASERRIGKFERAGGGTLLLDEISEMAYPLQAKLLRAIQEREVDRHRGTGTGARRCEDRRHDEQGPSCRAFRQGRFREDLYYRLNVFPIILPPSGKGERTSCPLPSSSCESCLRR